MKLITFLVLIGLVAKISAAPRISPYYRGIVRIPISSSNSEESAEADEEAQSDETDVEVEDERANDEASDEEDPPPKFEQLFPAPQNRRTGPSNMAFMTMMHEIDENGWKRPKEVPNEKINRLRSVLVAKPVYRMDDDDSEEEEEDDAEDDEPYNNDMGGPISISDLGRTMIRGRSEPPRYYGTPAKIRQPQPVRYVQQPKYVRIVKVQPPANYGSNRRVVPTPMNYNRPSYYYGNQEPVRRHGYQTGPVYMNNYGHRQYYDSAPVRRTYVPINVSYNRRPAYIPPRQEYYVQKSQSQSPYMRMRRNGKYQYRH